MHAYGASTTLAARSVTVRVRTHSTRQNNRSDIRSDKILMIFFCVQTECEIAGSFNCIFDIH